MPNTIRDGKGNGYLAGVDKDHRLLVTAKSEALQHLISQENEQAYQVIGHSDLVDGESTSLHVKNTSDDMNMIITYVRFQVIGAAGGTDFPNALNYFNISLNRSYSSGGIDAIPVNVFEGSGNAADVEAYQDNPTLTGTKKEIDRWYVKANGDMDTFNKEGAVIIGPGRSIGLSFVGDQTAGILYSRLSFLMEDV